MRLWALTLDVRLMSLVSVGGGNSDDREFDVRPLGKVREDPVQSLARRFDCVVRRARVDLSPEMEVRSNAAKWL